LSDELNAWSSIGKEVTLWWRDDDACCANVNLERLLNVASINQTPICLAVVPMAVQRDLRLLLSAGIDISVAVHGIAHKNFSDGGKKKCELSENRPIEETVKQLAYGFELLVEFAGKKTIPVLVPPWNRIAGAFIPLLPKHGFVGISTYGGRRMSNPATRLLQVNCHIDPIDWKNERRFMGEERTLAMLIKHLKDRRHGQADPDEPTGLLTHHAIWSDEAFEFVTQLLSETARHPAVRWLRAQDVFDLKT
tara:strand:- start:263 stop:1012 length:750 start_codon:yes stop_codon:yes gene_type:complete